MHWFPFGPNPFEIFFFLFVFSSFPVLQQEGSWDTQALLVHPSLWPSRLFRQHTFPSLSLSLSLLLPHPLSLTLPLSFPVSPSLSRSPSLSLTLPLSFSLSPFVLPSFSFYLYLFLLTVMLDPEMWMETSALGQNSKSSNPVWIVWMSLQISQWPAQWPKVTWDAKHTIDTEKQLPCIHWVGK